MKQQSKLLNYTVKAKKTQGFTIIELIMVVLILEILLFLVVPHFKAPLGRYNLEASAYSIAEGIRLHMQQTINAQDAISTYRIKFDISNDKYFLQKNNVILKKVILPSSVDLFSTNFDWDSNKIKDHVLAFSINGNPYPRGGTITLKDRYSGEFLYVIIANVTGRVRVDNQPPSSG